MSRVLVVTTSLRKGSNSDLLAEKLMDGAREAGHQVEEISLKGKKIGFCVGCLACQKTMRCVIPDDAREIAERMKEADTLVFVTPIYYYEMSGQMKTLLDRMNPLYPSDYRFRKVYMMATAAEDEDFVPEKAVSGLRGWVECFPKAAFAGALFCGGLGGPGEAGGREDQREKAFAFGRGLE